MVNRISAFIVREWTNQVQCTNVTDKSELLQTNCAAAAILSVKGLCLNTEQF